MKGIVRTFAALAGLAVLGTSGPAWPAAGANPPPANPAELLSRLDQIRTSDHPQFLGLLHRIDGIRAHLNTPQRDLLDYFRGWEAAYEVKPAVAIPILEDVQAHALDPLLRIRATGTLINVLNNESRYLEAYGLQEKLIAALPGIHDTATRLRIFADASSLYANAGQSELALRYADRMQAEADSDMTACHAAYFRTHALWGMPGPRFEADAPAAIARCTTAREPLWSNSIRVLAAERALDRHDPATARAAIEPRLDEMRATGYEQLVSEAEATESRARWMQGDLDAARAHAMRAVQLSGNDENRAFAYRVLYEASTRAGDHAAALDWYVKYANADRHQLDDTSARALAYQMVHQRVQENAARIDDLNRQNRLLRLKQELSARNWLDARLAGALLLAVLGSVGWYAVRTKRSQRRFRQLAQFDGLTGILNHQHFVQRADEALLRCRQGGRDASLVAIDVDHFKQVNDALGHAAGDAALRAVVAACRVHLRPADVFGRTGGEEFCILLPACDATTARTLAEAMRRGIAALHDAAGAVASPVTASFGVAATKVSGHDLRHLMAHADHALYQSKRGGRNRVTDYDPERAIRNGPPPGVSERRLA